MKAHVARGHALRRPLVVFVALVLALVPLRAGAKLCGDDVDGTDVPCACGDTVVSDLRLDDDPVATTACPGDGLLVRAPEASASLTVDLMGRTLQGSGRGAGLWLFHGGPGGARVISTGGPAAITEFQDGLVAHGPHSVALIDGVVVRGTTRDGVRLFAVAGAEIRNTQARNSGRDGFWVSGRSYQLTDTRAVGSERYGYQLMGDEGTIGAPGAGNAAETSGQAGFTLRGRDHRLVDCVATGSARDGITATGTRLEISGCVAQHNGGAGIRGRGKDWHLARNQALDNARSGIVISGADIVDGGGNVGRRNGGETGRHPVAQCEINQSPCGP